MFAFAGVNLSIKVLQAGSWPLGATTNTPITFSLPSEFETSIRLFETFYHNGFSGRKLNWLYYLCQSELKLGYLKKPYIITMQTYQMAILLLFETIDKLTCKEIQVNVPSFAFVCDTIQLLNGCLSMMRRNRWASPQTSFKSKCRA